MKLCNNDWHVPPQSCKIKSVEVEELETTCPILDGWIFKLETIILPSLNSGVIYNLDPPDASKWTT